MNRPDWNEEAIRASEHFSSGENFAAHRGAMTWRCIGVSVVFGNDGYTTSPYAQREVELVRAAIARLGITELGFGLSPCEEAYDLRLMSPVEDVGGIPTEGQSLVIVAAMKGVLRFRSFNRDGRMIVDTDETKLPSHKARRIPDLRKQLEGLWPPHQLITEGEKELVITAVASIVGFISVKGYSWALIVQTPEHEKLDRLVWAAHEHARDDDNAPGQPILDEVIDDMIESCEFGRLVGFQPNEAKKSIGKGEDRQAPSVN
jgi:hypothetical protein